MAYFIRLLIFCALASASSISHATGETVRVSDFGAIPNDGKCDMEAVAKAVKYAKKISAKKIVFDAGVYEFDVGDPEKKTAIVLDGMENLEVCGATDRDGNPGTVLMRKYKFRNAIRGMPILYAANCPELIVRNLVFDNNPRYMTCGEIVANDGKSVTVKILEGNPCPDGTLLYCANLWDAKTHNLKKKPSLTFGGANVEKRAAELTATRTGAPQDRLLRIPSPDIAANSEVGDILSWNFGWEGLQVHFLKCRNLRVENITTHSAIGFCMQSSFCRNVRGTRVRFKRDGNQMHVGSRDAWKLYCCSGTAIIRECYFEGVRWDGQNVHGRFAIPFEKIDERSAVFSSHFLGCEAKIFIPGTKVGFWKDRDTEVRLTIKSAEDLPPRESGKKRSKVEFVEEIPSFADKKTVCNLYGINIDSYILLDSEFRNIAGTASLIRNDNATISGCKFDHIMYPAICVGGALFEDEGVSCANTHIADNSFDTCGWSPRHDGRGAIALRLQYNNRIPQARTPYIMGAHISGNTIANCDIGIDAADVRNLHISGNKFINTPVPILHKNNPDAQISPLDCNNP